MDKIDYLTELALKYKTDKCPQIKHPFTPFYFDILKDKRTSVKKVLEIGIGWKEMALRWRPYRTGASLFMWRDFFPGAKIYGVDIEERTMFTSSKINTFIYDQTKKEDLLNLTQKIGTDLDLIIDDGSHKAQDQIFTCLTLMPVVKKGVIYIIEDVNEPDKVAEALSQYSLQIPKLKRKFRDDNVIVVRHSEI